MSMTRDLIRLIGEEAAGGAGREGAALDLAGRL
jgi:hypothetical protein